MFLYVMSAPIEDAVEHIIEVPEGSVSDAVVARDVRMIRALCGSSCRWVSPDGTIGWGHIGAQRADRAHMQCKTCDDASMFDSELSRAAVVALSRSEVKGKADDRSVPTHTVTFTGEFPGDQIPSDHMIDLWLYSLVLDDLVELLNRSYAELAPADGRRIAVVSNRSDAMPTDREKDRVTYLFDRLTLALDSLRSIATTARGAEHARDIANAAIRIDERLAVGPIEQGDTANA